MNINNKNSWKNQGLPTFWGSTTQPLHTFPTTQSSSTSPPHQAKWTEGSDCWDGALVVVTVGDPTCWAEKKHFEDLNLWWMLCVFCFFQWFLIFVSPWGIDLSKFCFQRFGWVKHLTPFNICFVWKFIFCCLSYQQRCFPSPQKKTVSDFLSQAVSHDQPQATHITLPAT